MNKALVLHNAGYPARSDDTSDEYFDGAEWLEITDDNPHVFAAYKEERIDDVRKFADIMRLSFLGNASIARQSGFKINNDILNLIDAGITFENLDQSLRTKILIEVAGDDRYATASELIAAWRKKRGEVAISSAWAEVVETSTIKAINEASDQNQVDTIITAAQAQAETKYAELTQSV